MSNGHDMAFPAIDRTQTPNETTQLGLTKREYIAAHIMAASVAAGDGHLANHAVHAVRAADYLLAELAKEPS